MKAGERTWNLSLFREENMTFWPRSHPVVFPHLQTDHWSKMKTMVPVYLASVPAALLKDRGAPNRLLPPLTPDKTSVNYSVPSMVVPAYNLHQNKPKTLPQNTPQLRNEFNDRARRGFCYWVLEKKGSACKGYSFGAYKTSLGLPKV
ncbi:hypothetical protein PBY51_013058 [Eleginops maclovinus]|uniref:Uncharacterized protein n=1 Tax=Eleginops maclovinus TaxID=56733 RepID=A0AAN7Y1I5_ELEMC|nr:hypothetical protein PBY51_013058 [Eleginops maclovinus]